MRHRKSRLRLRHKPAHSRSMQRNIVTSLILYETVRTTKKRAEVVRPSVEKLITVARTKAPHIAIRYINQVVTHKNASKKLMEVLKARYANRPSGYTRIVPLGARQGDGAKLVALELMDRDTVANTAEAPAEKPKKAPAKPKKTTKAKADAPSPANA